jgi:hypothetical protein
MNPIVKGVTSATFVKVSSSNKSLAILPIINGTTIKNENLAAFSLSIPNKTEVDIVAPDLEIPGKIAMA